ncbi:MAG: HAMP domain-containing sensor histidine kinase [Bacillota bacterium]
MRIFHRLFATHLLIAVLALVISSGYAGYKVWSAFRQVVDEQLMDYGRILAALLADRDWNSPEMRQLQETIDAVERGQSVHIWLVDREGLIRMASSAATPSRGKRVAPETVNEVLKGEPVILGPGVQPGIRSTPERPTPPPLRRPTVAVPVVQAGEVKGAVFLVPASLGTRDKMREGQPLLFFLTGAAIAAGIVAAISYYVSQRIARPITLVSEAGRQVARGDFTARVDWRSPDEVGALARGFNEMAAELGRLEGARKELLAHVSHELKGPLTRISGYIEAIHDGIGGEAGRREHFAIVRQEVGRLTRLVNDLLDVSRLEAGRLKLHPIPCDLAPYLTRAAAVFESPAAAAGVALVATIPSVLPVVEVEPERVEQVLVNLLQNGLAHTPPGGTVAVRALVEGERITVTVTDTGPGIPPEELPLVWERFHKVDRARTPDKSGSGLGLTIARQLVELQGGRVWVESTVGQGSTFGFQFPLATPEP